MSNSAQKQKEIITEILLYFTIFIILVLSAVNIKTYFTKSKVLGISTKEKPLETEEQFWNNFLSQHPDYIPGWKQIGRNDMAKQIDPNF